MPGENLWLLTASTAATTFPFPNPASELLGLCSVVPQILRRNQRMCIPVLLFALSGYISPKETPHWLNDYAVARQQGQAGNKPLAVFVGYGRAGWEKLAKEGRLGKEVE